MPFEPTDKTIYVKLANLVNKTKGTPESTIENIQTSAGTINSIANLKNINYRTL
jgi:hypothetical protein